jgi:ABC-2 type transport system permease protein
VEFYSLIWALVGEYCFFVLAYFFGLNGCSSTVFTKLEGIAVVKFFLRFAQNMPLYINEIKNLPIATLLISFIIYFIGGYFLYSSFCSIGYD